jgi:RNA polymerase sigma-70 factor, ECF subfamily
MELASSADDITELLHKMREGDGEAERRLMSLVYGELHGIAVHLMRAEHSDHILQPTALVNEAFLRLAAHRQTNWKDRAHFFAVASQVMRHVLVDYARQRLSYKRGAGLQPVNADLAVVVSEDRLEHLLVLDDLLHKLEADDARAAQVVMYRLFGGLGVEEIAQVMKISSRSVKRDWQYGRAWLKARLDSK